MVTLLVISALLLALGNGALVTSAIHHVNRALADGPARCPVPLCTEATGGGLCPRHAGSTVEF